MTREEVSEYCSTNQDAMMMLHIAADDYVAGRCCLLHGFFSGMTLLSQSIEKILKGYLLIGGHQNVRGLGHNLSRLAEAVDQSHGMTLIATYGELLERFQSHYDARYHDNPNRSRGKSSEELSEVDVLILHLIDNLPMPDEVKFRSGIMAQLFHNKDHPEAIRSRVSYQEYWYLERNAAFLGSYDRMLNRYLEVLRHLYPTNS